MMEVPRGATIGVIAALVLAFWPGTVESASLDQAETMDVYSQAKELFRQANETVAVDPEQARELYRKSAMRFERLVREGDIHNGRLFYNIGNACFRMEDLGRAIFYYRLAQQYIPNDVNLQQNLAHARAKCPDRIDEKQQTKVLKTVFFWHYDLSTRTRSLAFFTAYALVWLLAAVRLCPRRLPLGWPLGICAIVAVLSLASLLVEVEQQSRHRPGVIVSASVIARKGDSERYEKSFTEPLHAGTEFSLVQDRGNWVHIELADGRRCWIPAKTAELVR